MSLRSGAQVGCLNGVCGLMALTLLFVSTSMCFAPGRAPRLVRGNLRLVLLRQSDVIEPLHQTVTVKVVYHKRSREALIILHHATLEIDRDLITLAVTRSPEQFLNLGFRKH